MTYKFSSMAQAKEGWVVQLEERYRICEGKDGTVEGYTRAGYQTFPFVLFDRRSRNLLIDAQEFADEATVHG
jgi:hypothetical protein